MKYLIFLFLFISLLAYAEAEYTTETFLQLPQEEQLQILDGLMVEYRQEDVKLTSPEYLTMIERLASKNPAYGSIPIKDMLREIIGIESSMRKEEKLQDMHDELNRMEE